MLHPTIQIEAILSFQEEKRQAVLKLQENERSALRRPSFLARLLYAGGGMLITMGHTLKRQAKPGFSG
jgi:hypothetical protein